MALLQTEEAKLVLLDGCNDTLPLISLCCNDVYRAAEAPPLNACSCEIVPDMQCKLEGSGKMVIKKETVKAQRAARQAAEQQETFRNKIIENACRKAVKLLQNSCLNQSFDLWCDHFDEHRKLQAEREQEQAQQILEQQHSESIRQLELQNEETITVIKKETVKAQRATRQVVEQQEKFRSKIIENKSSSVLVRWRFKSALACLDAWHSHTRESAWKYNAIRASLRRHYMAGMFTAWQATAFLQRASKRAAIRWLRRNMIACVSLSLKVWRSTTSLSKYRLLLTKMLQNPPSSDRLGDPLAALRCVCVLHIFVVRICLISNANRPP